MNKEKTLNDYLYLHDNDYTHIERIFAKNTGVSLLGKNRVSLKYNETMAASVIIPSYNSASRLKFTLESIAKQQFTNKRHKTLIEVVVVDDGSDDNTREVCRSFKEQLNLRYIYTQNNGAGVARNIGAFASTGDVLFSRFRRCPTSPLSFRAYYKALNYQ
jgi:cellulose synthase/poly-beta-1,6-N-acetylglucosamine synthase-like glycosyltransferase